VKNVEVSKQSFPPASNLHPNARFSHPSIARCLALYLHLRYGIVNPATWSWSLDLPGQVRRLIWISYPQLPTHGLNLVLGLVNSCGSLAGSLKTPSAFARGRNSML